MQASQQIPMIYGTRPGPLTRLSRWVALIGIAEGLALNAYAYSRTYLLGNGPSTDSVQSTPWASLLGVPVTLWAILLYALLLMLLLIRRSRLIDILVTSLAWALLLTPAWFMLLQWFVLHRTCGFCIGSHLAGITAGMGTLATSCKPYRGLAPGLLLVGLLIAMQIMWF